MEKLNYKEKPNYVLYADEAILKPINSNNRIHYLKIGILAVIAFIVICSLVFQDNLFLELSWSSRVLLLLLAAGIFLKGEKEEYFPSPMEIRFYEKHMMIYFPKRYYSRRVSRMEIHEIPYESVSKCSVLKKSERVHIYCDGKNSWYNYKRDGTLPEKPTSVRNYKKGLVFFSTHCAKTIDFKKEIELHSPITVSVENE